MLSNNLIINIMKSNKKPVILSYLSLICVVILFMIIILFHLFRSDHDPLLQTMSEYTIGPFGIFLPITLITLGSSSFLSYFAMRETLPMTRLIKNGIRALLLWAIFITIAGIFPTDYITGSYSFSRIMHGISSYFAFLSLPFSYFYFSLFYQKEDGLKFNFYRFQTYFYLCLSCFIIYLVSPLGYKGLTQRIFLAIMIISYIDLITTPLRKIRIKKKYNHKP